MKNEETDRYPAGDHDAGGLDIARDDGTGARWEYSCYYHEDTDSLSSVSSSRLDYTINPDNGERVLGEYAYEGLDDENSGAEFTIDRDGFLIWKDGREDAGAGLKFINIGRFDGLWKNEKEGSTQDATGNDVVVDDTNTFAKVSLFFDDEIEEINGGIATEIINAIEEDMYKNDSFYTIQGIKVAKPTTKGVYIHNGKKIFIK